MTTSFSRTELSYASSSVLSSSSSDKSTPFTQPRIDGRTPLSYRPICLSTSVAPQANGSSRVRIGGNEIEVGAKLEVEDINGTGDEGGRLVVEVECTPSSLNSLSSDPSSSLSNLLTSLFSSIISSSPSLVITPLRKRWTLYLDILIISSEGGTGLGSLGDLCSLGCWAALWDTKVPKTRSVRYESSSDQSGGGKGMDGDETMGDGGKDEELGIKGLVKGGRGGNKVVDFELEDYWDEGDPIKGREDLPICLTFYMINSVPFLDALPPEQSSAQSRLTFAINSKGNVCNINQYGEGEVEFDRLEGMIDQAVSLGGEMLKTLASQVESTKVVTQ